jgi:hypothetical protein
MEQKKYKNLVPLYLSGNIEIKPVIPFLTFDEDEIGIRFDILTPNDLTILFGPSGCGKSRICAFLIRQFLLKIPDRYFLKFPSEKEYRVVCIDTEMSEQNVLKYFIENSLYDFNVHEMNTELQLLDRYEVIPLIGHSIPDRIEALREIVTDQLKYKSKYEIIFFIDNLGSFCDDLNSSANNKFVNDIKTLLAEHTVLSVLHSNHKEHSFNKNNATGSIGTIAERLAQNVIQVENPKSNTYTLQLKKSKTQDDKGDIKIEIYQQEADGHLIFSEIKQSEISDSKRSTEKLNHEKFFDMLLLHLKDKADDSPDRTMKSIVLKFKGIYGKSSVYDKIKSMKEINQAFEKDGFIFLSNETPF